VSFTLGCVNYFYESSRIKKSFSRSYNKLSMYMQVATLYAVMRDTEYMQKAKFKENFWTDWKVILGKNHVIQNLEDCDFTPIYDWCQIEKEKKKQLSAAVSCFMYFHLKMIEMNISKHHLVFTWISCVLLIPHADISCFVY